MQPGAGFGTSGSVSWDGPTLAPIIHLVIVLSNELTAPPRFFWTAVVVCLLTQAALVSWTFPLHELFSDTPLFYIDGAMHWYRITAAQNLAHTGNLIGIDPFFGAGVPVGIATNPAAKIPAIMAVAFGLDPLISWKLYAFGCAVFAPACVPVAARLLHLDRVTIVVAVVLGILLWWTSMFRWFHTAGLVSFVFAAFLGLPYLAGVIRYAEGAGRSGVILGLGAVGAVGLYFHPLFPVPIIAGTLILFAMRPRLLAQRRILNLLLVVPLLAVVADIPWIYPTFFLSFMLRGPSAVTHQAIVDPNMIWMELLGIWKGDAHGANLYPFLALGAAWAVFRSPAGRGRLIAWGFTVLWVSLALYAAVAAVFPTLAVWTQPNRFSPVAYLYLTIPSSIGVSAMLGRLGTHGSLMKRASATVVLFLCGLGVFNGARELMQEISYGPGPHYGETPPEVKPLGDYTRFILSWLAQHTTPDTRVLFETSNGRVYDRSHIAGYLAYVSRREFIGGPYPFHNFASFWDGVLFSEPISEMTAARFRYYADLYNIGSVVVFSEKSKRFFDSLPFAHPAGALKQLRAYKLDGSPGYFIRGSGTVVARTHNRIQLARLSGPEVVLKYHFLRGLRSDPPARLEPIHLKGDSDPFIRILSPPPRLTLSLPWPSWNRK